MLEISNKTNLLEQKSYKYQLQDVAEPNLYRDIYSYDEVPKVPFNHRRVPMGMPEEIWITDTTLRDGQQSVEPYSVEEIVEIYKLLARLGGQRGLIRQTEFFIYSKKDREAVEKEKPTKSKSEIIMEEAVRNPMQKEERANANPSVAKTDKSPLSRQNSEPVETQSDKGVAKPVEKPSVKEKLDRYKAQAKQQKEAERKEPEVKKDGKKPQQKNGQTVHRQPKKKPKTKER